MFSLWKGVWWCNLLLVCFFGRTEKKDRMFLFFYFPPSWFFRNPATGKLGRCCVRALRRRTVAKDCAARRKNANLVLCVWQCWCGRARMRGDGLCLVYSRSHFLWLFFFPLSFSEFVFGVCSFLWCALSAMTATSFSNLASIFYVVIYQRSSILRLNGERQHWTIQCFWREEGMFPLVHSVAFCFAVIRSLYVCSFSLYFCLFIKKGYFAKIYIIQQSSEAHMFIWHCFTSDLIFLWSYLGLLVQNE